MNNNIVKKALLDAAGIAIYILAVASFMSYVPNTFEQQKSVLVPVTMLSLLVLSAAITGSLMFGRSVLWYLDGNKKDAVTLLFAKLVCMLIVFVISFAILS